MSSSTVGFIFDLYTHRPAGGSGVKTPKPWYNIRLTKTCKVLFVKYRLKLLTQG